MYHSLMGTFFQRLCAIVLVSPTLVAAQASEAPAAKPSITIQFSHTNGKVNTSPFNNEQGVPLFRAMIADEPVCALLDTGADLSVVGLLVARKTGLAISEPKGELAGLNSSVKSHLVTGVPIEIPGQLAFTRDMVGAELPEYTCPDGTRLGFVLGMDFLGKMAIYLDNVRQRMILAPGGYLTPKEGVFARIAWSGGQVDGAIAGVDTRIKVDTGSSSALSVRAAQFAGFFPSEPLVALPESTTLGGRFENQGVQDVEFSIGPLKVKANAKRVTNLTGSAPASIGYQIIGQTSVIIDASEGAIFLRKPGQAHD